MGLQDGRGQRPDGGLRRAGPGLRRVWVAGGGLLADARCRPRESAVDGLHDGGADLGDDQAQGRLTGRAPGNADLPDRVRRSIYIGAADKARRRSGAPLACRAKRRTGGAAELDRPCGELLQKCEKPLGSALHGKKRSTYTAWWSVPSELLRSTTDWPDHRAASFHPGQILPMVGKQFFVKHFCFSDVCKNFKYLTLVAAGGSSRKKSHRHFLLVGAQPRNTPFLRLPYPFRAWALFCAFLKICDRSRQGLTDGLGY